MRPLRDISIVVTTIYIDGLLDLTTDLVSHHKCIARMNPVSLEQFAHLFLFSARQVTFFPADLTLSAPIAMLGPTKG